MGVGELDWVVGVGELDGVAVLDVEPVVAIAHQIQVGNR